MLSLNHPITKIPGVGEASAKKLAKLNLFTISDLIHHYPSRHIDYAHPSKIAFLRIGVPSNFIATIDNFSQFTTKTGKPTIQATATDDTGSITLTWFYSPFIKNTIQKKTEYRIAGTPIRWGKNLSIISPQLETADSHPIHTKGLVPIYPSTAGISAKLLRRFINFALAHTKITDNLPKKYLNPLNLPSQTTAINNIHFPADFVSKDLADKRLSFNKHLKIARQNLAELKKLGKSPKLAISNKLHKQITKKFPFNLTPDQKRVISSIYTDLSTNKPTHRLIQGDTGSGKTVLAIFAAAQSLKNNYSFILMAPTQILANQHHLSFKKILGNKNIHLITSPSPLKNQPQKPSIFIGTHALLNQIPDNLKHPIAAIFIDEQHKFGVKQRQTLQKRTPYPHIFNLTATPIPRTIALGLFGEIKTSAIKNNPQKNKNIKTFITDSKHLKNKGFTWLKNRLKSADKIFVVAPVIKQNPAHLSSTETIYRQYQQFFAPDYPVYLLHSRIPEKEKQKAIDNFKKAKSAILVATPVIEVGLNITDVTTIIIYSAERFGLASLHQLRGRVARRGGEGFCFLIPSRKDQLETERLTLLTKHKSGLALSKLDLKLRGAGKIFGTAQHGRFPVRLKHFWNKTLYAKAKYLAKSMLK